MSDTRTLYDLESAVSGLVASSSDKFHQHRSGGFVYTKTLTLSSSHLFAIACAAIFAMRSGISLMVRGRTR
jgi:hypothetical protein